jgi:hypothetical protein
VVGAGSCGARGTSTIDVGAFGCGPGVRTGPLPGESCGAGPGFTEGGLGGVGLLHANGVAAMSTPTIRWIARLAGCCAIVSVTIWTPRQINCTVMVPPRSAEFHE